MNPSRIAELLDPFLDPANGQQLTADDVQNISTYIDILQRWNARINLTAIRSDEEIVTRHFGESLFIARHLFPKRKNRTRVPHFGPVLPEVGIPSAGSDSLAEKEFRTSKKIEAAGDRRETTANDERRRTNDATGATDVTVADIGSGAGFPGLPIKLWAPEIRLTLIESNHKKATFLREIVRALTLTNVDIQNIRAESLANAAFNVVTLRAVERFHSILPIASSLIAPGGRLALLIGKAQLPQAQATLPTLSWSPAIPIPHSDSRVVAIAALR